MTRYFSASVCYEIEEGGWVYYLAAVDREQAERVLERISPLHDPNNWSIPYVRTEWTERRSDESVVVDRDEDAGRQEITLGTLRPGEVRTFTW